LGDSYGRKKKKFTASCTRTMTPWKKVKPARTRWERRKFGVAKNKSTQIRGGAQKGYTPEMNGGTRGNTGLLGGTKGIKKVDLRSRFQGREGTELCGGKKYDIEKLTLDRNPIESGKQGGGDQWDQTVGGGNDWGVDPINKRKVCNYKSK